MRRAVRGKPPRTAEDALIQREVGEQVLADNGVSRQDIHGVDRDVVAVTERHDLTATVRRACAAAGRVRLRRAVLVAVVANAALAAVTASSLAFVAFVVSSLAAAAIRGAPDFVFEDPDPEFTLGSIEGDGLTDHEVMRRLEIVQERDKYREELAERERDANTKGKSTVSRR